MKIQDAIAIVFIFPITCIPYMDNDSLLTMDPHFCRPNFLSSVFDNVSKSNIKASEVFDCV